MVLIKYSIDKKMETPPKSFHARGLDPIVWVQGRMTAEDYRAILRTHLLPYWRRNNPGNWGFPTKQRSNFFGGVSIFLCYCIYSLIHYGHALVPSREQCVTLCAAHHFFEMSLKFTMFNALPPHHTWIGGCNYDPLAPRRPWKMEGGGLRKVKISFRLPPPHYSSMLPI